MTLTNARCTRGVAARILGTLLAVITATALMMLATDLPSNVLQPAAAGHGPTLLQTGHAPVHKLEPRSPHHRHYASPRSALHPDLAPVTANVATDGPPQPRKLSPSAQSPAPPGQPPYLARGP